MEELFRFSVIRAATRSNAAAVSLERPSSPPPPSPVSTPVATPTLPVNRLTNRFTVSSKLPAFITTRINSGEVGVAAVPPLPPKSFQDQLRDTVQSLAGDNLASDVIWKRLEPIALDFVLNHSHIILTNSLWAGLLDFFDSMQQAIANFTTASQINNPTLSRLFDEVKVQSTFEDYQFDLADLFIAFLIIRRGGTSNLDTIIRSQKLWEVAELLCDNPTLEEVADRLRIIDLVKRGPTALAVPSDAKTPSDVKAATQEAIERAMNKTLLFPPAIFAPLRKPVHGVGFRELYVVKQHIRRYEMAEVGRIENILKGESRDHSQKHTLSNEKDTFFQTDTTTENDKELTSTDHVDIKNETQNQVKEDTKVDAGVHAQYDGGGSFKLQADLTVSYDKSTDDTKKFSSDVAKDITQKSVNKVTQRVTQSQTTKIIETFEETEDQSFDNKSGQGHISGVYQWVEKVYLAQVFNLGRHMLLDIMVPEPGASLLAAATTIPNNIRRPVPPYPLGSIVKDGSGKPVLDHDDNMQLDVPLNPLDLSDDPLNENFYGHWVARYGATGVEPPPSNSITVAKPLVFPYKDDDNKQASESIHIDDGYSAYFATVSFDALVNDDLSKEGVHIDVTIGSLILKFTWPGVQRDWQSTDRGSLANEEGSIALTVYGANISQMSLNIEVTCQRTSTLTAKWQLQSYEKIFTAWQNLHTDYENNLKSLSMEKATVGPLGAADPEANRLTERIELKRSCVAFLDNSNETVRGVYPNIAVQDSPNPFLPPPNPPKMSDPAYQPVLPEPILPVAQQLGAHVRWFEQAFEWENIAYISYPYFWGRRSQWVQGLNLKNDDPLFLNFLQAGYARVVIPVRLGFERAMLFYLHTGLPWLGGGLPPVGDKSQNPLYLDIAEEIKALTGGGENKETETPIGEPWEYILPTTLIKLRKDDALPEWHRVGPDLKENETKFPSDAPGNSWSWKDGEPKP